MDDDTKLENKINDFELTNNVRYYDIIQVYSSTFLIIFNENPNKKPRYCINRSNITKKSNKPPTKISTITPTHPLLRSLQIDNTDVPITQPTKNFTFLS